MIMLHLSAYVVFDYDTVFFSFAFLLNIFTSHLTYFVLKSHIGLGILINNLDRRESLR